MTTATDPPAVRPADAAAAGCLPRKSFECEVKAVNEDGTFELYAAAFGNIDRQGDVIEPGAFDNLEEFTRDGWIALNHDNISLPVGYPTEASQDGKGLKVVGAFHTTPEAQAVRTVARERLAAGKAVKCSLGYVTREESYEKQDGRMIRRIKRLSIYEASFVNLPANPAAEATSVKGTTMPETKTDPPAETKRSVAISAANRQKMSEFSQEMDKHHDEMSKCMKSMKACHKAMCDTHEKYKSWAKSFEAADDGEDDDDDGGEDGRKDKKGKEVDTDDANPPKALSREAIARKLAGLQHV